MSTSHLQKRRKDSRPAIERFLHWASGAVLSETQRRKHKGRVRGAFGRFSNLSLAKHINGLNKRNG